MITLINLSLLISNYMIGDVNIIRDHLEALLSKNREELRDSRMINLLGEATGFRGVLFDELLKAAYHIIDRGVLTLHDVAREHRIMDVAASSVTGFYNTNMQQVHKFVDHLNERKAVLPRMFDGYIKLGDDRAVDAFFDIYEKARGNTVFILDGIEREVIFPQTGYRIRKIFPDYDYNDRISKINGDELRNRLKNMFYNYPYFLE